MIVTILEIRVRLIRFFQRFQIILIPLLRFLIAFIVFHSINGAIGKEPHLMSLPAELALSFIGAFTPSVILVLLGAFVSLGHVFYANPILAILVAVLMFVLYCFIARFSGKFGYVVLAIPVMFILKIPYVVPLFLGLIATPITIIPMACGVIVYRIFIVTGTAMAYESSMGIDDILQLYNNVIDQLLADKQMLLTIAVFSMIVICMYLVRKLSIEYIFEISIASGTIVCILGFLIANILLPTGMDITTMVFGAIGSMVIMLVVQFFRIALDYSAVEHVQFEDDDYLYYVKAVPKIKLTVPKRKVKKISTTSREKSVEASEMQDETDFPSTDTDISEEALIEKKKPEDKASEGNATERKEPFSEMDEDIDTEVSREERYALGEEFLDEDEEEPVNRR